MIPLYGLERIKPCHNLQTTSENKYSDCHVQAVEEQTLNQLDWDLKIDDKIVCLSRIPQLVLPNDLSSTSIAVPENIYAV
jgi:hypothetical protein